MEPSSINWGAPGYRADAPRALIFRARLLPYSETFIQAQVETFRRYEGIYVGLGREKHGLSIDERKTVLLAYPRLITFFRRIAEADLSCLRNLRPAILHAHFGPDAVLAHKIARRLGIPLVVTFHGYDVTTSPFRFLTGRAGLGSVQLYPSRLRSLFRDSSVHFLAVSRFVADQAAALGCPRKRLHVHYTGTDTAFFSPDRHIPMRQRSVVLFVGRLVEVKGGSHLIGAVAQLKDRLTGLEVRFVGEGPERHKWEDEARELGVRATFIGALDKEGVRAELLQARVLCVPSIRTSDGAEEAFGMVFAEAQSMGVPVVSYATGGIPEAVEHGVTGYLAEPGNVPALAEWLEKVVTDEQLAGRLALAACNRVRRLFSLEDQTAALELRYDEIRGEYAKGVAGWGMKER